MIDLIIVAIYLISLLFVGIFNRSKKTGFKGFSTVSNDKLSSGKLILIATIFVSSIGGGTTFGLAEKVFSGNIAYSYGLMFAIIIDILIGKYIVPKLALHHGAESIGDIMDKYYGYTGRFISGSAAILVSVGLIAAQISVSGRIFEYILEIEYLYGVIISYGIIIIYTTFGGLRSVLFTNQLQFFAIILSVPIISIFGLYKIGIYNFINHAAIRDLSLYNNKDLIISTMNAALGFSVMNLFPHFIQRSLISKDASKTARAIYIKSGIYAIFLIFITFNGLIALILYPEVKPSLALPYLIGNLIPTGLQGIVLIGLLAAVMSTADSDLNITSITLVKDFLSPIFNITNQQRMLFIARITNIFIGSFAIIIALQFSSVVDLVVFIAGFWGPIVLVPLIFALYGIVIPNKMMAISSFLGSIGFLTWEYLFESPNGLKGVFVGTMINFTVFIVSYLFLKLKKYTKQIL